MSRVEEICKRLALSIENPKTELAYASHYTFLIAVILSAQTTDVRVNKVTSCLFKRCKTVDDILNLGLEQLENEICSIGIYKNKAKYIINLSNILKLKYNSEVPSSRSDLESLPGVGRKTANIILNTLFNEPVIAVDTHVLRLSKRLGFSKNHDPIKVEKDLERVIPAAYKKNISNMLVLHGRYVCKAKKPDCFNCSLQSLCEIRCSATI